MYISPHAHLHTREIGECTEMNCENSTVQSILLRITLLRASAAAWNVRVMKFTRIAKLLLRVFRIT